MASAVVSVMPYPLEGARSGSCSVMRSSSFGGAGAPPYPRPLRLEMSYLLRSGWDRSCHTLVGTPVSPVILSRSISSSARPGSHLYMSTRPPPVNMVVVITAKQPVTWKSGTVSRVTRRCPAASPGSLPALITLRYRP